jgi:[CysO sulfur-carrier protein]-S-L-cysteine hydrolase
MSGDQDKPWIKGNLSIDRAVLEGIHAHALEAYPSECCGFASGPASDVGRLDAAVREANEADKYHKLDPIAFPRTSTTYFKINELRALKAFDQGEKSGQPIKVIYHSHCDAGAYFSQEDAATFAADNVLMWECAFIVVSVMKGEVADTKLWVHVPGTNGFAESSLTVK